MHSLKMTVTRLLLDRDVKLDRDQLDQAEASVLARIKFDDAGRMLTSIADLVDDERAARPELFERKSDAAHG